MTKQSAGILLYRWRAGRLEVFLVHPGGPFWAKKDDAAWSIPKGEFAAGEDPLAAARRELREETGVAFEGPCVALGAVKATTAKVLHAFAASGDVDPEKIVSNAFQLEWPPRSGQIRDFPEVDRAAWFPLEIAAVKIHRGQADLLERLSRLLASGSSGPAP